MLMNVNRSPQCVTVMPHVMILWGALTAHVKMDILETDKPAMVCTTQSVYAMPFSHYT